MKICLLYTKLVYLYHLFQYSLPGYLSGVTTATTPTLTPTTLASIERTFIELQSVPVSSASQDPLTQSGFVPPIVDPVSQEHSRDGYDYSDSNSDQEWISSAKRPYSDVDGNTPSYQGSGRKRRRYDDKVNKTVHSILQIFCCFKISR